jgi:hypothetical protein
MRFVGSFLCACAVLGWAWAGSARAQDDLPPIGTIDIFGTRTLTEAEVRAKLGFSEGDHELPQLDYTRPGILARALGVEAVTLDGTCCDEDGNVVVFVGIDETGNGTLTFNPAPSGDVTLPQFIGDDFLAFNSAVRTASASGANATEDLSQGHSIISDETAREYQERFLVHAAERIDILQRVLRESSDRTDRAIAAYIMGYAPDKQSVVDDLVHASMDPDASVRTNATRALAGIATLGANQPGLGITIPPDPFISMINSVVYSDRTKGMTVLGPLSKGRRPEALDALRERALPALIEMSRWNYFRHNVVPYEVLGRVVGLSEEEIDRTMDAGREETIARAADLAGQPSGR